MSTEITNCVDAHKLINLSLNKIAQSRSTRCGASLRKSLLVASVLHKARFIYLEEANHYHNAVYGPPTEEFVPEPPRAPTPLPEVTVTPLRTECDQICDCVPLSSPDFEHDCDLHSNNGYSDDCSDTSELELLNLPKKRKLDYSDDKTDYSENNSDCKRTKSEEDQTPFSYSTDQQQQQLVSLPTERTTATTLCSCGYESSSCCCDSSNSEVYSMEVDHLTSLVSIFSFNQQQQQVDHCSTQAHLPPDPVGPHVLALTA